MPELADIFILPKYRKRGIAKFVIRHLMQVKTNQWHVAVYLEDSLALNLWSNLNGFFFGGGVVTARYCDGIAHENI